MLMPRIHSSEYEKIHDYGKYTGCFATGWQKLVRKFRTLYAMKLNMPIICKHGFPMHVGLLRIEGGRQMGP